MSSLSQLALLSSSSLAANFNGSGPVILSRSLNYPDSPQFVPSTDFDGEWLGRRINTTGNNMCERTTITGIIREGKATLRLTYNGTQLEGWVTESGDLRLYAKHCQWDYRFSAIGSGKRFDGRWHLTNGPCQGTWFIEKVDGK